MCHPFFRNDFSNSKDWIPLSFPYVSLFTKSDRWSHSRHKRGEYDSSMARIGGRGTLAASCALGPQFCGHARDAWCFIVKFQTLELVILIRKDTTLKQQTISVSGQLKTNIVNCQKSMFCRCKDLPTVFSIKNQAVVWNTNQSMSRFHTNATAIGSLRVFCLWPVCRTRRLMFVTLSRACRERRLSLVILQSFLYAMLIWQRWTMLPNSCIFHLLFLDRDDLSTRASSVNP